jgi:hypothetical protein
MTDPITKMFTDFVSSAQTGQHTGQVQTLFNDGLAKTREATLKSFAVAKDGAAAFEQGTASVQRDSGELATKIIDQVIKNTESAFAAMQALTQAKSPIEAAQLQTKFIQAQFAAAGEQGKELFELSTKLAKNSTATMTEFAAKATANAKA